MRRLPGLHRGGRAGLWGASMLIRQALQRAAIPTASAFAPNGYESTYYDSLMPAIWGEVTASGETVSIDRAMTLPTVFRCVELIASVVASLPLKTYRGEGDSRAEIKLESDRLVWGDPNPEMERQTFWEIVIAGVLANGNAYINTVRDGSTGRISELWPVHPARVEIRRNAAGQKVYIVDQQPREWTDAEVLHIPGFGMDGLYGLSKIGNAAQAIGLALAAEKFGARLYGAGGHLGGILKTAKKDLTAESAAALKASWREKHAGISKSWDVAILDADTEYIPTMVPPEDAQFLETRKYQATDVAGLFGVPPHLVGIVDVSTSWGTGIEQQNIQFINYTLRPLATRIEQAITRRLLVPQARFARFSFDGLLRGDTRARIAYYGAGRKDGWLSANDIRRKEDMPPIPRGDTYQQTPTGASPNASAEPDAERGVMAQAMSILRDLQTTLEV